MSAIDVAATPEIRMILKAAAAAAAAASTAANAAPPTQGKVV
jgi:hypothetical protein